MSLFRRRNEDSDGLTGRAVIGLYGADAVEAVHVEYSGESAAIHFLVPSYFDKILFNLTAMPAEQRALLDRVEEFVVSSREKLDRWGNGLFAGVGMARLEADRPRGKPFATITVEAMFLEEAGRAGASTEFAPLEATNETVAELGLWTLWDWSIAAGEGEVAAVEFLLDVLEAQCVYYRENGMPDLVNLGVAPFLALTQRLARDMGHEESQAPEKTSGADDLDAHAALSAWDELWRKKGEPPVDSHLWRAILDYVKTLDWGHGDPLDLALRGVADDPSKHDPTVARILVHTACAGYFWREAEVQTDQVFDPRLMNQVEFALGFIEDRGVSSRTFHGQEEPVEVAAAFWAIKGLDVEVFELGRDLEPALRATVDTLTNSLIAGAGWAGELPPRSRDQAFLYGYALRAARDGAASLSVRPRQEVASESSSTDTAEPESHQAEDVSGNSIEDVGLQVVNAIAEMMSIDAEWSTREARGFTWWGKDHAQRVWSEPGYDDEGIEIFRLHARTPLVRDFETSPENLGKLNALSMLLTTSGFLVSAEERTVELAASMYLHEETTDWVRRWFGQVVAMQAADAQLKAQLLAEVTGSSPATSAHPTSGQRDELDDVLNVLEQVVVPRGEDVCAWQGDDMRAVVEIIRGMQQTVMANGDAEGLTAEFPFQSRTSLLTLTTEARNPQLGNGVLSLLRLPVSFDEEDGIRFAHDLNRRELTSLTRSHLLGSWCWQDDTLHFVTFLPNALYLGGADLLNFTFSCAQRARWVAETIYGDDWGANLDTSGRPLATPAVHDLVKTVGHTRSEDMVTRSADGGLVCHGWPTSPHDPTSMASADTGNHCPACGRVVRR